MKATANNKIGFNHDCNPENPDARFTLREYDKYDGYWIDIAHNLTASEARRVWNKKTKDGTRYTHYDNGTYFLIFPEGTRMLHR